MDEERDGRALTSVPEDKLKSIPLTREWFES